jgi:hypothetical protein
VDPNDKGFFEKLRHNLPRPNIRLPRFRQPNLNLPPAVDPDAPATTRTVNTDTLLLVAALVFLSIAILLAVLFPPVQRQGASATPEPSAAAQQTASAATQATAPAVGSGPTALPEEPYPAPGDAAAPPTAFPTSDAPLPTPAEGTSGAPAGGLANQPTAYPAPGGQAGAEATVLVPTAVTGQGTTPDAAAPTQPPFGAPQPPVPEVTAGTTAEATAAPDVATVAPQVVTAAPQVATSVPQTAPTASRQAASSDPPPTRRPTQPPAPPVDVVRGTTYWTAARSPIVVGRNVQIPPGAALIVEPGTEVRLGPGVAIFVEGQLLALGQPGNPVRFVGADRPRWEGIFGRAGSNIVLENTEVSGGGAGGTTIGVDGGTLALRGARIRDNGGHVRTSAGTVELRDSEIAGNDMPYGAALDITFTAGGTVTLISNRIGGNRMATGAPPVQITSQSTFDTINLDIQRNLLVGQDGPDLALVTNGQMQGNIVCNALIGGANGLSVRGGLAQVPGLPALRVRENAIEKHTPPILPVYLEFGIGRGATSSVALDMRENWWESEIGPYEPDRYADGRGDAVGANIEFQPWLRARPACAPVQ